MNRLLFLVPVLLLGSIPLACPADETAKEKTVSFRKDIKPILKEKCVHCHNRKTLPGRVSFESAKLAFGKNAQGKEFIVPGKAEQSLIIQSLTAPVFHEKAMPMVGPRPTKKDIEMLRRWISQGAEWPKGLAGTIRPTFIPKE